MTAPFRTSRTLGTAAKRTPMASALVTSVAPVASRDPRTRMRVRPCDTRFSRPESTICPEGDR